MNCCLLTIFVVICGVINTESWVERVDANEDEAASETESGKGGRKERVCADKEEERE